MTIRQRALSFGTLLALSGAAPLAAQGIAIRASTLGIGGELSFRPSRNVGLRVGGNAFNFSRTTEIEGIDYDIKPKLKNGTAIVDLHPFGGAFHLSGGVMWNDNRVDVEANLNGPITIGDTQYQPSEVGSLTGNLRYTSDIVPYAGLGFGGNGRVSLLFDIGVLFTGHPKATLTSTSNLTGPEKVAFDQDVAAELEELQADIDDRSYLKYYPVVSLGLRIRL